MTDLSKQEILQAIQGLERSNTRKACLLGTEKDKFGVEHTGLEILCGILGYNDLGEFHRKECVRIEDVNPYIALRSLERAKFKADDLQEARMLLSKKPAIDIDGMKRIWLWSRGHFKTSIITIAHTVQLILIDPNIRILIMHNKLESAKDILRVIKQHFMNNERFRYYFPEYCPMPNKVGDILWDTSERVIVLNRTIQALVEPTIDTGGVDTIKTGLHYDYMKKDDLVTQYSVTNDTMLQQSIDADAMSKSLFDNPEKGPEDYIGTRYHFADMYSAKLRTIPAKYQSIIACYTNEGRVTFSEKFTEPGLERIKLEQGPYIFSTQYMLNPVDPEHQIFKKVWINWYTELPKNLICYLLVDPATTKKKRSDFTAMMVIGVNDIGNMYVCDMVRDKLDVTERIEQAWALAKKWNIEKCLWESVGFQETDIHLIKELRMSREFKFYIEEVKTQGVAKEDRIRALQPYYSRGQVFWPHQMVRNNLFENKQVDYIQKLLIEFETFPMCEHDDMLDAHSMILKTSINKPSTKAEVRSYPAGSLGAILNAHRRKASGNKLIVTHR